MQASPSRGMSLSSKGAAAAVAFTLTYAICLVFQFGGEQGMRMLSDVAFQFAPMVATLACAFVATRTAGRERRGWALFASGLACWAIAEWIWAAYDLFWQADVPLFSYADPIYYAGYVLLMWGAVLLVVPEGTTGFGTKSLLDGLLLIAVLTVLSWRWLWIPIYEQTDADTFGLLITLGYPVLDLALAAVIIFAFYRGNAVLTLPAGLLVLGAFVTTLADGAFLYLATVREYDVYGNPVELGWVVGYLAFALAAVARLESLDRARSGSPQRVLSKQQRDVLGLVLPYAALVPLMALFAIDMAGEAPNPTLSVGLIAAVVLVTLRQFLTLEDLVKSRHELERLNEQLQESMSAEHHLARTDALTGIPNRRLLEETIETEVARARRYGRRLVVMIADLDDLKHINDGKGHQHGDEALQLVASAARQACRQADLVGRYGGDEFVIVMPSTDVDGATVLAERFQQFVRSGGDGSVSVSMGLAEWTAGMAGAEQLLASADEALRQAKASGKDRYAIAAHQAEAAA